MNRVLLIFIFFALSAFKSGEKKLIIYQVVSSNFPLFTDCASVNKNKISIRQDLEKVLLEKKYEIFDKIEIEEKEYLQNEKEQKSISKYECFFRLQLEVMNTEGSEISKGEDLASSKDIELFLDRAEFENLKLALKND